MKVCLREEEPEVRKKRQRLATVMVLLAQGIPFLHSGQEFFRTKQGSETATALPMKSTDWIGMKWSAISITSGISKESLP